MAASIPLMFHAQAHGIGTVDPFMRWTMRIFAPMIERWAPWLAEIPDALVTYGLLALTLVVMVWAGRRFYAGAWAVA